MTAFISVWTVRTKCASSIWRHWIIRRYISNIDWVRKILRYLCLSYLWLKFIKWLLLCDLINRTLGEVFYLMRRFFISYDCCHILHVSHPAVYRIPYFPKQLQSTQLSDQWALPEKWFGGRISGVCFAISGILSSVEGESGAMQRCSKYVVFTVMQSSCQSTSTTSRLSWRYSTVSPNSLQWNNHLRDL